MVKKSDGGDKVKIAFIANTLSDLPTEVIDAMFQLALYSLSGIE